jgi:hypothetical protein
MSSVVFNDPPSKVSAPAAVPRLSSAEIRSVPAAMRVPPL